MAKQSVNYTNGDRYDGDFEKGKFNGSGIYKFSNGNVYDGDFEDGKYHGLGIYKFANGNVYEGEFEDGKFQGAGTYTFADGQVYEGEWIDNKKHGQGWFNWVNGDSYDGDWVEDNMCGIGILKFADGRIYRGPFLDGVKHGKGGTFKWANGEYYQGDWVDNKRTGEGINKWANGNVYDGDWLDDKRTGWGNFKSVNGDVYDGWWLDDKYHDQGTYKFADGRVYDGDIKNGKWNGKGIFKWADGNVYEGDWLDDKRTGWGIFKWANGDVYEGDWLDDKYHGQGTYKFADGRVYEGDIEDGKWNGKGVYKWVNGEVYDGDWLEGKRHGKGVFKYANGNVYEGDWVNDERNGKCIYKFVSGNIYEGGFLEPERNGKGMSKYANGDVFEGDFINGEKHGKGIYKFANGDVFEGDYKEGEQKGKGIYRFANKDVYKGDCLGASIEGTGKLLLANGESCEGEFSLKRYRKLNREILYAKGIYKWLNGNRYKGFLSGNLMDGYGILFEKENNTTTSGIWCQGQSIYEVLKDLIQKNNYLEVLDLCYDSYNDYSEINYNVLDNDPEIKSLGLESYETHRIKLKHNIEELENKIFNDIWTSFKENVKFRIIPTPAYEAISISENTNRGFPEIVRIGSTCIGNFNSIKLPIFIPFSTSNGFSCIVDNKESKNQAVKALQLIAFRLLFSIPDRKCKFFIIDPENSGQNFPGLFGLDHRILEKEIWDDEHEIRDGLLNIKNSIPNITSQLLTTKYKDLIEYNSLVQHSKQPFQFLLIANFPRGFTRESAVLLLSIIKNGAKAGVYCLMSIDYSCPFPFNEFRFEEFRNITVEYDIKKNKLLNSEGFEILNHFKIKIEDKLPDDIESQKEIINKNLNKTIKVELEAISKDKIWKNSSALGITIPIGMSDDGNLINLQLGDGADVFHALIGGATGKGKTVLLHDLIINGAKLYHPDELQFILMDYKEGTEFNVYQKLPHLKVLTVSSEIEFGLSVLEFLNEEIVRRGNLFKSEGVSDFSEYKLSGKGSLPRFLVIMDEFQVLLNPQKRTTSKIAGLIEDLTRRGRSFGINLIFSTQSLGDVDLSISTLGQIGVRIAMSMPSHDCIRILNMDNDLPVSFTKAGQAVYNNSLGRKEANITFQVAFIEKNNIKVELDQINSESDLKFIENQIIFDGNNDACLKSNFEFSELLKSNSLKISDVFSDIYIGEPFYLSNKHFSFRIRKQQASNLFIVGDDPKAAISVAFHTFYQLAIQSSKESRLFVIDMFGVDSGLQGGFDSLKDLTPDLKITSKVKSAEEIIGLVKTELAERVEEETRKGRIILCLMNINSFRQLKRSDYNMSPLATDLLSIIKDGPEYGIHTIIHSLSKKSFEEIFEYNIYNEFENLVLLKGSNPSDFGSEKDEIITKEYTAFVISPGSKYSADKIKIYKPMSFS